MDYAKINADAIDKWVKEGWEWGQAISEAEYQEAKRGNWHVLLTPVRHVPREWFAPFMVDGKFLPGTKLLGLASGGGQQMPIFSAVGADCTVLDYSDEQLASEARVAEREGYAIEIVKADMSKRLPFADESFDVVFHPVSNVYIEDVQPLWHEIYRILKPGGIVLSGLCNEIDFLFDDYESEPLVVANRLPFNPLKNPEQMKKLQESDGGIQFSHGFEEQIGGQLKAGLTLTDVYEDVNKISDKLIDSIPAYWVTRAVKRT